MTTTPARANRRAATARRQPSGNGKATGARTKATSSDAATPRRRRSAEETRRLLLESGTQLVLQSLEADDASQGGPLAHIRVQDVVREASQQQEIAVTTGALYNLWPTQSAFQVDLMFFILDEAAYPTAEHMQKLAGELFAQRLPLDEVGSRLSDESFRLDLESRLRRVAVTFTALAGVPAIRDALRAGHESLLVQARELYSQLLTYSGLQLREAYTMDQLITVVSALTDGMLQKHDVVPELFEVPDGEKSLVALATEAVCRAFCEPATP